MGVFFHNVCVDENGGVSNGEWPTCFQVVRSRSWFDGLSLNVANFFMKGKLTPIISEDFEPCQRRIEDLS
jgi:hypothetical protein